MTDDEPPSLAEFREFNAGENYWTETTTISVPRYVKASLEAHKDSDEGWGEFLERLRQHHADPLTMNDAEAIAEYVGDRLEARFD
jgi:hypothetical protein